ncbi:MAG TPA: hypothetical protein VF631_12615 [Allosphingosinicella sp.]|uniref:hypothetical protein n=1 Tax=Allosphingosinicella sp. TaxID=2823234 RepID=UPI002F29945E
MMKRIYVAALAAGFMLPAPAIGQAAKQERPALLKNLTGCRTIAESTARLACFDRAAAAIDQAEARKDLVVVDRDQLRTTRRTLFGLTLPNLSVFGDDSDTEEGVSRIESTIKAAYPNAYGRWILTLADGAQWEQADSRSLASEPRPGRSIKIRKAAMGSYLANIDGQTAIRVRRMR